MAVFSLSSARRVLPHAETRFHMRRLVFGPRVISACGDRCSAYGGTSPHAEIRVSRAEDRLRIRRPVFCVLSACGDSYSSGGPSPHAEIGFPRAEIGVPRAENLVSYVYYTPPFNLVRLGIL